MLIRLYWVLFLFISIELALADKQEWQCDDIEGDVWSCAQTLAQNKAIETSASQKSPKQKATDRIISLPTPVPIKKPPVSIKPPQKRSDKSGWNCFLQ